MTYKISIGLNWGNQEDYKKLMDNVLKTQELAEQALKDLVAYTPEFSVTGGRPQGQDSPQSSHLHEVVETPKGLYIDGHKLDFVVEDSVSVRYDGGLPLVTLTLVASSFEYRGTDTSGNCNFYDQ